MGYTPHKDFPSCLTFIYRYENSFTKPMVSDNAALIFLELMKIINFQKLKTVDTLSVTEGREFRLSSDMNTQTCGTWLTAFST